MDGQACDWWRMSADRSRTSPSVRRKPTREGRQVGIQVESRMEDVVVMETNRLQVAIIHSFSTGGATIRLLRHPLLPPPVRFDSRPQGSAHHCSLRINHYQNPRFLNRSPACRADRIFSDDRSGRALGTQRRHQLAKKEKPGAARTRDHPGALPPPETRHRDPHGSI